MIKIAFSTAPEILISVLAWCYEPFLTAAVITATCVFASCNVYRSL